MKTRHEKVMYDYKRKEVNQEMRTKRTEKSRRKQSIILIGIIGILLFCLGVVIVKLFVPAPPAIQALDIDKIKNDEMSNSREIILKTYEGDLNYISLFIEPSKATNYTYIVYDDNGGAIIKSGEVGYGVSFSSFFVGLSNPKLKIVVSSHEGENVALKCVFADRYGLFFKHTQYKYVLTLFLFVVFGILILFRKSIRQHFSKLQKALLALVLALILAESAVFLEWLFYNSYLGDRSVFFAAALYFLALNSLLDQRRMYNFIFKFRWPILLTIFIFLVISKYHGSSVGLYDDFIQPGLGGAYKDPILGKPRIIRTDEWTNATPRKLAAAWGEDAFSLYNNILRGTSTLNTSNGMYYGLGALAFVHSWGFLLFGVEYGMSWWWFGLMLFAIGFSTELFYILTKKNKVLSAAGGLLFGLSPFLVWWSYFDTEFISAIALIVFVYYFFNSNKLWKKSFFAIGLAIAGSNFVCKLYPAWQVPLGYFILLLLIWLIISNIKKVKKIKLVDWIILGVCFCFSVSIIISYFKANLPYIELISSTVYPGKRFETGGTRTLCSVFSNINQICFPYKDYGNPCEPSSFFFLGLFPIAGGLWMAVKTKDKFDKLLLILLLAYSAFLLVFVAIGFPEWLAKVTLMDYSTSARANGILTLCFMILLVLLVEKFRYIAPKSRKAVIIFAIINALFMIITSYFVNQSYMPYWFMLLMFFVLSGLVVLIVSYGKKMYKVTSGILILIALISGITVNPLMKGLETIYSKPVAKQIMNITEEEPDAKWIALGNYTSGFTIACGAPTINSCNYYPNMELWEILDSKRLYENVYNRFAYVGIELVTEGETYPELVAPDSLSIYLYYKDLDDIGIKYIFSTYEITNISNSEIIKIYHESNSYIYRVNIMGLS